MHAVSHVHLFQSYFTGYEYMERHALIFVCIFCGLQAYTELIDCCNIGLPLAFEVPRQRIIQ